MLLGWEGRHMSEMVSGSVRAGVALPVQGTSRGHPTMWQQLCQCCSQGISHCSLPWPKCLSKFKLYHLQTVIAVCKGSVFCCTDLFLNYFNTAIALNRCPVPSKAPAGIMLTAGSGPSSLQTLTFAHQHCTGDFGVLFQVSHKTE